MAGAMAGSAILEAMTPRNTLGTVTLTINNECNLTCPHCYLQYGGRAGLIADSTLTAVLDSSCDRICVVGKEPLSSRRSIARLGEIVAASLARGKAVSLITNGLNAALLPSEVVSALAWIDISLDGGPKTYERYRRGSWRKLSAAITSLQSAGAREIRFLQTLSRQTAGAVDDMLDAQDLLGVSLTMFSPYQVTRSDNAQSVDMLTPEEFINVLAPYRDRSDIIITMDALYGRRAENQTELVRRGCAIFGGRFVFVGSDPVDRGLVRVTYDGLVLSPFDAVDTAGYRRAGRRIIGQNLDSLFAELHATKVMATH